jgi:DNA-binding MarR family transcriptional regulator
MADDLPEPHLDAWRALLNARAVLVARAEDALAADGLPPLSWYDVLWPLYDTPERKLRAGELANRVVTISRTGLTRLVDRIEAAGLVQREPAPADRRGTQIAITPGGVTMLQRMWPVYAEAVRPALLRLSDEEAESLAALLRRLEPSDS